MKKISIQQIFAATDWHKKWVVRNYSILSSSLMCRGYHQESLMAYGFSLKHHLFIQHGNAIVCYQSAKENENFGRLIAEKIKRRKNFAKRLAQEALKKTQRLKKFCQKPASWLWQKNHFKLFRKQYTKLLPPFVAIIRSGNFLTDQKLAKEFKIIQKARIRTETIYNELDAFIKKSLGYLAKKEKMNSKKLSFLTLSELENYLFHKASLPLADIKKRTTNWGLCFMGDREYILNPKQIKNFERLVMNSFKSQRDSVSGQSAYPGFAKGIARIILNPKNAKFNNGDILITGMTRPEFLPLMKKAAAIVTDAGGVLCHAAIVAREMKKPCVIGTQIATKVLKDGDLVEVDANKGIVKKIR